MLDAVELATNHSRLLEMVALLGVDHASIEKALMNAKRDKIGASKDAAAEKIERLKLEEVIAGLKSDIERLQDELDKAKFQLGDEGAILRAQITQQQTKIAELKVMLQEQRTLMMKMDLARVQELGIARHAKLAQKEKMVDFAQDRVEESKLVPILKTSDMVCQTEEDDDDGEVAVGLGGISGGGGIVSLKDIKEFKNSFREKMQKQELETWKQTKAIYDDDELEVVDVMEGRELAPMDSFVRDSPRKTARSALMSGRVDSERGAMSVRIQVHEDEEKATATATVPKGGKSSGKGDGGGDSPGSSRPQSRELAETARVTLVDGYGGERPSTAETQVVHAVDEITVVGGGGEIDNPFSNAFVNVPVLEEGAIPRPPTVARAAVAPVINSSETARTDFSGNEGGVGVGGMGGGAADDDFSEISDSVLNTTRSFGFPNVFGYEEPVDYFKLIKSTRVKEAAAVSIQMRVRGNAGREKSLRLLKQHLRTVQEADEGLEEEKENEADEDYNRMVDENERLETEKMGMLYQMEAMRKELEALKSAREPEPEPKKQVPHHKGKAAAAAAAK
jgi:hypothetical protein